MLRRSLVVVAIAVGVSSATIVCTASAQNVSVVELFTSQGCSSCPPADRLLSKLEGDARVVPLSFHVDYWNYIGWTDPFSSARWSERQQAYARAFASNRVYTPQLVVNGTSECVGSNEGEVRKRIAAAEAMAADGQVNLRLAPAVDGRLPVKVTAKVLRPGGAKALDLWVALYESGLTTPVKAGENARQALHNDFVVRRFEKAFSLPASAGAERAGDLTLALDKGWKPGAMGVVAFLQDPATLAIHGASQGVAIGR
jgi:hypothetical protein